MVIPGERIEEEESEDTDDADTASMGEAGESSTGRLLPDFSKLSTPVHTRSGKTRKTKDI